MDSPQIEPLVSCATCAAVIHPENVIDHSAWHGKQIEWFRSTNSMIESLVHSIGLLIESNSIRDGLDEPSVDGVVIPFPGQMSLLDHDGGPA